MQITFRWYGKGNDRIKLSDIKQIHGVTGSLNANPKNDVARSIF